MDIAVVIATNRENCISKWLERWQEEFHDTRVIIVEDNPTTTFADTIREFDYKNIEHYAWDDIDRDLRKDAWIIPRRTSAVKSYGFWKARNSDAIWTLDDDCYPEDSLRGAYLRTVEERLSFQPEPESWHNTISWTGFYPRGYPYEIRHPVMVHHGLWSGVPDLDGITALKHPEIRMAPATGREVIPVGKFFPMCGMNLTFRREMLPAMYFMLMGHDRNNNHWGFDRFDDIWAGLFVKRICDHLGYRITSGAPGIWHTKESDPVERVRKEESGIRAHEKFWQLVMQPSLDGCDTVADCYRQLARSVFNADLVLPEWASYWRSLSEAMYSWARICV